MTRRMLVIVMLVFAGCTDRSRTGHPSSKQDEPKRGQINPRYGPGDARFDEATVETWTKRGFEVGWVGWEEFKGEYRHFTTDPRYQRDVIPAFRVARNQ